MLVKEWNELPDYMQVEEVRPYYEILRKKKGQLVLKRIFDICVSLVLIVLLSPIIIFFSIWIKLDSKGPVFYRQERITQYGKVFRIFKFRTMVNNADKIGNLVTSKNDSRITKVGEKIRKYRIDEIPQLFNVLIGDMSFVGTRPEVKKYVDQYTPEMYATLLLPAGITSESSIRYKDEDKLLDIATDIDKVYVEKILVDKMKFNLESINNYSFLEEIIYVFLTIFLYLLKCPQSLIL